MTLSVTIRRIGIASAAAVALLITMYAIALVAGLLSLSSPDDPIGDPYFTVLEVLILILAPVMICMMAAVHVWAPANSKVFSLISVVFIALLAGLTSAVHFAILTLGRNSAFAELEWLLTFRWPSVVYALDILAWDIFFAFSALSAALVFGRTGLELWIRGLLSLSGVLALAGLAGVVVNDMQWRNVGIVGYAVVFPIAAALIAMLFWRMPLASEEDRARSFAD